MKIQRNQALLLAVAVFVIVLLFGLGSIGEKEGWNCENGKWVKNGETEDPKPVFDCKKTIEKDLEYDLYCDQDSDCACGAHMSKGECFVGNKRYIDTSKKCDKLCTDNLKARCVKNQCKQIK